MAVRRPEGAALLVAGYGGPGVGAFDASAVHTLGQIGEALLATGTLWQIRRLTASAGDRYAADRPTLKRSLVELVNDPVRIALIVLLGEILEVGGELALVTGSEAHDYPEDATLPLAWIHDRLGNARAEHLVVVISARGAGTAERWLAATATGRERHIIAVDEPAAPHTANPLLDALLAGLCGEALDPRTGTVTMASLSNHLGSHVRSLQPCLASETVAQPPPLAGLWDVRRSQLHNQFARRRAGDPEDLTGTVLPGRFRLDALVARGTFGSVYRARQLAVERDVAVKVLHGDIDPSSEDGRLFVQEIRSVGRIDHTNVVRIHQADITHDGRLFFAMELLGGSDLQQLGSAGPMARERAVPLVCQLLAGLGAAHDAGLVHADIKPANAIVAADDRLVLVDFGLARLRAPDRPTTSAGGTPAYMAPEQLHEGRVDARSDLFSAMLVLVWLLKGWRRQNALALVPPADLIDDADLRAVVTRALELDPAKRFQSARELSAALVGAKPPPPSGILPALPFRQLAPLTEADQGRLHGRAEDLAVITEHALYRRAVIYTAPSGTGKTSLLRAGLTPRLAALRIRVVYVRCRAESTTAVIAAIAPGAPSIAAAIAMFHQQGGGKLVLILDQLEAALGDPAFARDALGFERWPAGADVTVVLSIREDHLARLLAISQLVDPAIPIVRLPPLDPEGARAAISAPLAEARLGIAPELLDALLADLREAAAAIGPAMGWGAEPAVFPPHLQLVCSVLYEAMSPDDRELTLAHYRRLGGFEAIVGEHLDRVIESELGGGRDAIARDLFVALVTGAHERAIRPESELLSMVGAKHDGGAAVVLEVLEVLRVRGLLVRVRGDGEPSWELVHDSLVPRVLAWIDKRDLARRRAIEVLRYHLRRSTPEAPSLLSRRELRQLKAHDGAVAELDVEWAKRDDASGWTPSTLVGRSRRTHRQRISILVSVVSVAFAVGGAGWYASHLEQLRAEREASLRGRDLGRFTLSIEPFDWRADGQGIVPAAPPPGGFVWQLHSPDPADLEQPGEPFDPTWLVRGTRELSATAEVERVEAHGGRAFLRVERPGCSHVTVPLLQLPGYATREHPERTLRIRVPTCAATRANTVSIAAGPFVYGGYGEPRPKIFDEFEPQPERVIDLPAFRMDRDEVTNAQFQVFGDMHLLTGITPPAYPKSPNIGDSRAADAPVTMINWIEARAYCRFLGKELATTEQWTKALRGGLDLDGWPNPAPRRNVPWHPREMPTLAWIGPKATVAKVGTHPEDVSPYRVRDLAYNVSEWTATYGSDTNTRVVRGGNWGDVTSMSDLVDFIAIAGNPRSMRYIMLGIGVRCVGLP